MPTECKAVLAAILAAVVVLESPHVPPPLEPTRMRILYVVHGFPPDTWAGTEVYTLELALAMQRRGHEVTVVTRAPAEGDEPEWSVRADEFQGLRVLRVARRVDCLSLGESYRPEGARPVFEALLDELRPELVHFQHLLHLSVDWIEVARARGIPTVYTANDYWPLCARVQLQRPDGRRCPENQGMGCMPCVKDKPPRLVPAARALFPLANPLLSWLRRSAPATGRLARFTRFWVDLRERQEHVVPAFASVDLTIAPSRFLRERLLATGRFDPARVVHSDYGMRPAHPLERVPAPDGVLRFGFIGTLVPYKGIEVLLRAMQRSRSRACRLEVFGSFEPERDEYHARLAALARDSAVRFHGRFDNARLAEIYRELDLLVVPSTWFENSPLVIHEAFLHRTPVVTSDIGGMAELVRDGVDGLHFAVGDEASLARALARTLDEPDLLERLSRDFPRYKTLVQDAEEMEARYVGLLQERVTGAPASPPTLI